MPKKPTADRKTRARKNGALAAPSSEDNEMSNDLTQYASTRRAAELLGVVPDHVYRLIEGGKIKSVRLGHEWLIYVPSIGKYLETKSARGRPSSRKRDTLQSK